MRPARRAFLTDLATARRDAEEESVALDLLTKQETLLFSIIAHDLRNPCQGFVSCSTSLSQAVASKNAEAIAGFDLAATQAHALMEGLFAWASQQEVLLTIVRNSVGNATKFTPAGGEVSMMTIEVGDLVEITIADTGVRMPPEKLDSPTSATVRRSNGFS